MKIGVITDLHGNTQALEAVLNEFDKIKVEKILCLGDIIGIGPNPEETVQMLIKIKEKLISVRGNHEQYLLKCIPKQIHDDKRSITEDEISHHKWVHSRLSSESKEFLAQLPLSNTLKIENQKIYMVHYPINENGELKKHILKPNIEEEEELFKNIDSDIFLFGHTHTKSINNKDRKWYINPGSLGCPLDDNTAKAGILNINEGNVEYEQLNIPYDVNKTICEIEKLKYPLYKYLLRTFFGKI